MGLLADFLVGTGKSYAARQDQSRKAQAELVKDEKLAEIKQVVDLDTYRQKKKIDTEFVDPGKVSDKDKELLKTYRSLTAKEWDRTPEETLMMSAMEETLRSKDLLPEVEGGAGQSAAVAKPAAGSFEPSEADVGSEYLGMEYGEKEIDSMVAEARNLVASDPAKYGSRERLATAALGKVKPEALSVILDSVFPQKGGLLSQSGKPSTEPSVPAKINSKAEYDNLPSGTKFTDPDGVIRVKP